MPAFIGKGKIYARLAAGGQARRLGNCSAMSYNVEQEEKTLLDYESAGGGNAASLSRITKVAGSLDLRDFDPENIALGLYGSVSAVTAGAVSAEAHSANVKQGGLVRTDNVLDIADIAGTVTVTGTGGTPTYALDTDYTVVPAGIFIVEGGGIADDTALEISYTKEAVDVVQALVNSQQEFFVTFDGLNEVNSGKAYVVDFYKLKFSATQGQDLIGDDFGTISLTFTVDKDETITGTGLSQYMKQSIVQ